MELFFLFVKVHSAYLQQLFDTIWSIWTNISEECCQHLAQSVLGKIKAVLKVKLYEVNTFNLPNS